MLSDIICLVLFPLAVIFSFSKKYKLDLFDREFFFKRQTTVLKGICITLVVIHHFSLICTDQTHVEYAARIAQTSVALFFFMSGYNTCLGHLRSGDIELKKLWINRAWRLYLPVTILSLPWNNFLTPLLIFFVATDIFFIIFKENKKRAISIGIINVMYVVIAVIIGIPECWWDDVLTYCLGVAFAMYKTQILEYFSDERRYWISLILMGIISIISGGFALNWMFYGQAITVFSLFSCLIVILVCMKLNVYSRLFYFLGKYSWEIYLSHQMFMILLNKYVDRNSIVLVLGVLLSVLFSIIIQYLVKSLRAHTWLDLRKEVLQ